MSAEVAELDRAGLRRFALTTGGLVALLFGWLLPWLFGFNWQPWAVLVGGLLIVWGVVAPGSLGLIYRGWMGLALLLNKVTSPVIMGVVFFLVLLPMGLIMRGVARRDPLHRALQAQAKSYRVTYEPDEHSDLRNPF